MDGRGAALRARATSAVLLIGMLLLLVGTLALALVITGFPVERSLAALWQGSFGSWYSIASATLVRATPLVFTGLAVTLAFRAGIWNIGAEGQLVAGAAAVTAVALLGPRMPTFPGVVILALVGATAGAAWAGIAALLKRAFGVLEVISTIMLNFVAAHLVSYLVRGPLQEPLHIYPQSPELPAAYRLPGLALDVRITGAFPLAVLIAAVLWFLFANTAWGFRIRAIGANPTAARIAGDIDVPQTTFRVFLWSGALAGLAGAFEVLGVTSALYENLSPGYGYTAIAVALLARLHPLVVVTSAILFGGLEAGAATMQRNAGVPSVVVWVVEGALLLALLTIDYVRVRLPAMVLQPNAEPTS